MVSATVCVPLASETLVPRGDRGVPVEQFGAQRAGELRPRVDRGLDDDLPRRGIKDVDRLGEDALDERLRDDDQPRVAVQAAGLEEVDRGTGIRRRAVRRDVDVEPGVQRDGQGVGAFQVVGDLGTERQVAVRVRGDGRAVQRDRRGGHRAVERQEDPCSGRPDRCGEVLGVGPGLLPGAGIPVLPVEGGDGVRQGDRGTAEQPAGVERDRRVGRHPGPRGLRDRRGLRDLLDGHRRGQGDRGGRCP